MRIFSAAAIRSIATPDLVTASVRRALIDHAHGNIASPPPVHLHFAEPQGDCHIKSGHAAGSRVFVIKVATSFHGNSDTGLASGNGLMLVLSAETGAPLALLADDGWLTDARTAAAGALAVEACAPPATDMLGVLGAGTQAQFQARRICAHNGIARVAVWSRTASSVQRLVHELRAAGLEAMPCDSPSEVAAQARAIVTCTPSRVPLLKAVDLDHVRLIVAVGADMPGKRELNPDVIDRADRIVCDDIALCLDHGEIQGRRLHHTRLMQLGDLLAAPEIANTGLTVVDLTGLAAQDVGVASEVYRRLCTSIPASGGSH